MKKLLSILLCLILALSAVLSLSFSAAAEGDELIVHLPDGSSLSVPVGQEFTVTTHLESGEKLIVNGQVYVPFDSNYLSVVPYGPVTANGTKSTKKYFFPLVYGSSLTSNLTRQDAIYFNFSSTDGIIAFTGSDNILCRLRFKAIAPGETNLSTDIEYMLNEDEVKVYFGGEPDADINPQITYSTELAAFVHGDADSDFDVSIRDVTALQKICAGFIMAYDTDAADANSDGTVTLRDAVAVRKFLAGTLTETDLGTSYYESDELI